MLWGWVKTQRLLNIVIFSPCARISYPLKKVENHIRDHKNIRMYFSVLKQLRNYEAEFRPFFTELKRIVKYQISRSNWSIYNSNKCREIRDTTRQQRIPNIIILCSIENIQFYSSKEAILPKYST